MVSSEVDRPVMNEEAVAAVKEIVQNCRRASDDPIEFASYLSLPREFVASYKDEFSKTSSDFDKLVLTFGKACNQIEVVMLAIDQVSKEKVEFPGLATTCLQRLIAVERTLLSLRATVRDILSEVKRSGVSVDLVKKAEENIEALANTENVALQEMKTRLRSAVVDGRGDVASVPSDLPQLVTRQNLSSDSRLREPPGFLMPSLESNAPFLTDGISAGYQVPPVELSTSEGTRPSRSDSWESEDWDASDEVSSRSSAGARFESRSSGSIEDCFVLHCGCPGGG